MQLSFEREARKRVLRRFGHGRYLDAWSALHVLTGIVLGLGARILALPWWLAFSGILVILYLYETWEAITGIGEDIENTLADVALGSVGAGLVFAYVPAGAAYLVPAFAAAMLAAFIILFLGWNAYLKRRFHRSEKARERSRIYAGEAARRNEIFFVGLALGTIPLPVLFELNGAFAALWFALACCGIAYALRKRR